MEEAQAPPPSPGESNAQAHANALALMEGLRAEGVAFNPADPNELFELVDLLGEVGGGVCVRGDYCVYRKGGFHMC